MTFTAAHWLYLGTIAAILLSMACRRGVIMLTILGIFLLGAVSPNGGASFADHSIFAVQAVFAAILLAGKQLFDVILLVGLMLAMLRSLQAQGVDEIMVAPLRKFMIGPRSSFAVLVVATFAASIFFWPTPATALIGTVLVPVAARVGLPAVGAAMAMNLAGHGIALSADPVIQGATRITAGAAKVAPTAILSHTILFSAVAGVVALTTAAVMLFRERHRATLSADEVGAPVSLCDGDERTPPGRHGRWLALAVPLVLVGIAGVMVWRALFDPAEAIYGSDATALLGGTAVALLILSSFAHHGHRAFESIVEHLTEGFLFAFRVFAPVIPIVAFFLLGDPDHARAVLGDGTPGYLLDVGRAVGDGIGDRAPFLVLGVMLVGTLAGLDGSGFSGLPLVGAVSAAVASHSPETVAILASAGQIASIWVGGGTVVAWSGVCAAAGMAGVKPGDVARRNLIPVGAALLAVAILAIGTILL